MLQLSAEMLGTSGPLTALLNSHRLSETLLSNRVNKFPFIGASLTELKTPSLLKSTPFLSWGAHGDFPGQIRLWTRVNMCRRGWGQDQGVYHIQAGLSVQYTSCQSGNNGVTCPNRRNEWTYLDVIVFNKPTHSLSKRYPVRSFRVRHVRNEDMFRTAF